MARQANGTYLQPANTAAVSGQTISSTAFNTLVTDVGNEITNSVDRGGRSAMTAALPMGAQKITGMADPTVATDGATKNYVDTVTAAFFSTGDVKFTLKTVPDTSWLLCDDGTFGSATSGSSNRANADTQPLFNLFFANISDSNAPLLTSGGGATTRAAQSNAATAWAANCRMTLNKMVGRAIGIYGAGAGIGATYSLGATAGAITSTLVTGNLPPYSPAGSINNVVSGGTIGGTGAITNYQVGGVVTGPIGNSAVSVASTFTGSPQGGASNPVSVVDPIGFINAMIKL